VPFLFGAGLLAAAWCPPLRWLLVPGIVVLALVGASATLVGPELRYRYPQDPLIALVASAGVVEAVRLAVARLRRPRPARADVGDAVAAPDAAS
jgi:hypothetical protein